MSQQRFIYRNGSLFRKYAGFHIAAGTLGHSLINITIKQREIYCNFTCIKQLTYSNHGCNIKIQRVQYR